MLGLATEGNAMVFKKLPTSVRVNKKTYSIKYREEIEDGRIAGLCDPGAKAIDVVLEERAESESTVIHEILHAIAFEYKFPLSEAKVLML